MSRANAPDNPRRDLWIPAGFVLFFVALAGLQLWFVLLANRSFSGLVTDPPPAAHANAYPHAAPHGTAPAGGWTARLTFSPTGALAGTVQIVLANGNGAPLVPDRLVATAERTTRFPQLLPIALRPLGPGHFEAAIKVPLAGEWAVRLTLTQDGVTSERIETLEVEP